jgi:hypothetical protein|tara:strand:+ start:259 stop:546 length:288 start_codon:yes stop_codon:yes gene_type:complete
MSEQRTSNFITIGAGIAIVFALVTWFSATSNIPSPDVAVNSVEVEPEVVEVNEVTPEEIVVVSDELVEKANEAAIRNEVNQAMKNSEDTDIADAE